MRAVFFCDAIMTHGGFALVTHGHARAMHAMAPNRRFNRSTCHHDATDNCQVLAHHTMRLQLFDQRLARALGFSYH